MRTASRQWSLFNPVCTHLSCPVWLKLCAICHSQRLQVPGSARLLTRLSMGIATSYHHCESKPLTTHSCVPGLGIQLTNKSPVKVVQPRISPMKSAEMCVSELNHAFARLITCNRSQLKLTPTVSEDGSDDEGATVHGISPLLNRGGVSVVSPSVKKS